MVGTKPSIGVRLAILLVGCFWSPISVLKGPAWARSWQKVCYIFFCFFSALSWPVSRLLFARLRCLGGCALVEVCDALTLPIAPAYAAVRNLRPVAQLEICLG